ncbi:MAG: DUF126 domain-containing protein [Candidatus Lokiarchaeota archaeon]|nr:DUF126 domain-containing protein [Candidatus Lokiarchaeota archaeon]
MKFKGKSITSGKVEGIAVVSQQAINFLASYNINLAFPQNKGKISDKEHELFGQDLTDKILFVPCSVGSTTGGVFLLEAIKAKIAPKAIVIKKADSLLVSGGILAEIWLRDVTIPPIMECSEIFENIKTGDMVKLKKNEIELIIQ